MKTNEAIFSQEIEILKHAEDLLNNRNIDIDQLRYEYGKLTSQYKKLLKLSDKLVSMADKNHKKLKDSQEELEQLTVTDTLTSLMNRRGMSIIIDEEMIRFRRRKEPFMIFIIDIDHFKKVNDVYGHNVGDQVLIEISELMSASIREQDSLARWGGEEFLLLLPETDISGGLIIAEKLRKKIEKYKINFKDIELSITISIGGAVNNDNSHIENILEVADNALYKSKLEGRNRVNIHEC